MLIPPHMATGGEIAARDLAHAPTIITMPNVVRVEFNIASQNTYKNKKQKKKCEREKKNPTDAKELCSYSIGTNRAKKFHMCTK